MSQESDQRRQLQQSETDMLFEYWRIEFDLAPGDIRLFKLDE
jgi:hypothetical protein